MRVAIVHDDLVQFGGAERVLQGICEIFPDAPIFTSVYDDQNKLLKEAFGSRKITTSFLQKIPGWKTLYRILLPFYPVAFEQFDFSEFDLVISHTTRFAKGVITKPQTKHVSYCHTPPRFLWHFSAEKNFGVTEFLLSWLRLYDRISSSRVDYFIAGSKNAQERIKKIYKRDSTVVYPFIDLARFTEVEPFDGGYFLTIARLNKYKRIDLVIKACGELNFPLKIVGKGPELNSLKFLAQQYNAKNIDFYESLPDKDLVFLLAGAKALIIPGLEDFGLTSLEAQALGKPVIACKMGGVLETIIEGKTGVFFEKAEVASLKQQLIKFDPTKFIKNDCQDNAIRFSKEKFISEFQQTVLKN